MSVLSFQFPALSRQQIRGIISSSTIFIFKFDSISYEQELKCKAKTLQKKD